MRDCTLLSLKCGNARWWPGYRRPVWLSARSGCHYGGMTQTDQADRRAGEFRAARDLLLSLREDYAAASSQFRWPRPAEFNWALDWFDALAAEHPDRDALRVVAEHSDTRLTFAEL